MARHPAPPTLHPLEPRRLFAAARLVTEINFQNDAQSPHAFVSVNNTAYFAADDGVHGSELWKTDGTPAGTTLVKDITRFGNSTLFKNLTPAGNQLFFAAADISETYQLWRSDGTTEGTIPLTNAPCNFVTTTGIAPLGNSVVFFVKNGFDNELWISDGTPNGTRRLKSPVTFSTPAALTRAGDAVFFYASSTAGSGIWRTDGTDAGTTPLRDTADRPVDGTPLAPLGDRLVFTSATGGTGSEPWITDGTPAGTYPLADINPGPIGSSITSPTPADGKLFFCANDGTHGAELWATDGTPDGTRLLRDVAPGTNSVTLQNATPFAGHLYVNVRSPGASVDHLWRSDGTPEGTVRADAAFGLPAQGYTWPRGVVRGALYLTTHTTAVAGTLGNAGPTLWRLDHPAATPAPVRTPLIVDNPAPVPQGFVFSGNDGGGFRVWFSDGTPESTRPVFNFNRAGTDSASPQRFVRLGDRYLFFANDGAHGQELWTTDGTKAGTRLVKDVAPGWANGTSLVGGTYNGKFYFSGAGELWQSDGTPEGTTLVKELVPGPAISGPTAFTEYNGLLYFTASDGTDRGLWRTDGTPEDTVRLRDLLPSLPARANELRVAGGFLYFVDRGPASAAVYQFDGTRAVRLEPSTDRWYATASHLFLADSFRLEAIPLSPLRSPVTLAPAISGVTFWGELGNLVYFVNADATDGRQVWSSDGTPAGTHMVQKLGVGADANPDTPFFHAGRLYFTAAGSTYVIESAGALPVRIDGPGRSAAYTVFQGQLHFHSGGKLWRLTSPATAQILEATFPSASDLFPLGDMLLFTATTQSSGVELYRYPATTADTEPPLLTDAAFHHWSPNHTISLSFDEPLAATPAPGALQVTNRATGQSHAPTAVTYNPDTRTLAFTFATPLPDGDYIAALPPTSITDAAGNPLAAALSLNFFTLAGDLNRDRTVDFNDLVRLARNYNTPHATFAQGDLTGDGTIDFNDLVRLAQNYNATLPAPPPAPLFSTSPIRRATRVAPNRDYRGA